MAMSNDDGNCQDHVRDSDFEDVPDHLNVNMVNIPVNRKVVVIDEKDEEKMERVAIRAARLANTNSHTELREKERQISKMRTEMTWLRAEKKQKELANDDLRMLVEQKDREIQTTQHKLHQMKTWLEDRTDIEEKEEEILKLREKKMDLESELLQLKIDIDEMKRLNENKEKLMRKANGDFKDKYAEELEKEEIYQNKMANLTAEINRVKIKHCQTTAERNNAIWKKNEVIRENQRLREELENRPNRNR